MPNEIVIAYFHNQTITGEEKKEEKQKSSILIVIKVLEVIGNNNKTLLDHIEYLVNKDE